VYMKVGIDYSTRVFNECVDKGWMKAFDTRGLATLFMNNVFAGSLVRVQQDQGYETIYDPEEMFVSLQQYMLRAVETI